ncbi:MAG: hypothetical protein HYV63_02375 [Candidatus Schekmanbacteria bacterium]|nr:hypothetical protein [Candidatus Schekmanbacteria bacterium]
MERVGYLRTVRFGEKYLGAIMITDPRAVPKEVLYTEPIIPTSIQRILYGGVLESYLREEILSAHLLREIKTKPGVYIVHHDELALAGQLGGTPSVAVQATHIASLGEGGEIRRVNPDEVLVQPMANADPLRFIFGSSDPGVQEEIIHELIELSRSMDIAEPLERIERALEVLCEGRSDEP